MATSNKNEEQKKTLHFDVSSGLKSVLGSELITDDEVAVFELVKNSFDADAKKVEVYFNKDTIIIADDGIGMSYDDIKNKWLFVAYSSKKEEKNSSNFRNNLSEKRYYAGSKGIGRFSSDRLGKIINLQTRPRDEKQNLVHSLTVDWSQFDKNHKDIFEQIGVAYEEQYDGFINPHEITIKETGTIITIRKTKQIWDRTKILRIKSSLAKLINPFGSRVDGFSITIYAPEEKDEDSRVQLKASEKDKDVYSKDIVNGEVGNFIFSTLQDKTTFLEVHINDKTKKIESTLIDRGEMIYEIQEPNIYPLLQNAEIRCQIFFLNTSAKLTFSRRMGLPSVQFGSVFLFRNGFRVFPIGEDGDDWFKMDRRKQQGYARFLGSRDIIGRLDVSGDSNDFQESSSRDTGLIDTPSVLQLRDFFLEHCLKRLERYVVPVTFVDKEDKNVDDLSRLMTDPGRARVTSFIAKLADNDNIDLLRYSKNLVGIINERSSQFESSLLSLRAIAEKTKDSQLFDNIEEAEKKFEELKRSEIAARHQADEERKAKEAAQERAQKAESKAEKYSEQLKEEKKRSLFLSSITSLDMETILNLHHQVTIYSVDIHQQIENFLVKISNQEKVSKINVIDAIERISLINSKIMGITKFATKANFRLESEMIEADLSEYIEQYIDDIAKQLLFGPLSISVENDNKGFMQRFKPIDVSVVIDNLIANSKKIAIRATEIKFKITHPSKNTIHISISDNGKGFDPKIENLDRIFEKGFTMTDGSGLGLFHVRHVLGEMNGTISAIRPKERNGAEFLIRISK
ncbi:ATP-binding protein [Serratia ureilytica]|uniref:ATP-binding protein n=1 Tax=Serratia ureilytica TaxID=300181 RepID=UPI003FA760CB